MAGFFRAVIEGFYGRQWSWDDRCAYAPFLAGHGFDGYIYAPKGEACFRAGWRDGIDSELFNQLSRLGESYHQAGLCWGIGLSPLGLCEQFSDANRLALKRKVEAINGLGADILCLLFDDMPGENPVLAQRQLAAVKDMLSVSQARRHIVCPTYYSFDPVLEQAFGTMPKNYLAQLGSGLPADVDVFWTGDRVISSEYTQASLERVAALIGRKPVLWDNYPVNDGRKTSSFLHLRGYRGRSHQLSEWAGGHCVNPMNQPHLSRLVLATLANVYQDGGSYSADEALQAALSDQCSPDCAEALWQDLSLFQDVGLERMNDEVLQQKRKQYQRYPDAVAAEVVAWLRGGYAFDPACLTG